MNRVSLSTKADIEAEVSEIPFVKKQKVKSDVLEGTVTIYVKLSLIDYLFKLSKRIDEIHSILRPKMVFTITYEVKPRIIL